MSAGGVGRNIAENLARLGTRTHLVAAIGADGLGDQVLAATSGAGVHVEQVRRSARATGTYTAVLDADGELVVAVADMAATDELSTEHVNAARDLIAAAVAGRARRQPGHRDPGLRARPGRPPPASASCSSR